MKLAVRLGRALMRATFDRAHSYGSMLLVFFFLLLVTVVLLVVLGPCAYPQRREARMAAAAAE